tara:strand:- start:770 stop:3346 length:2577 start_codon:yes stop_codon:yes gene_type:complete
MPASNREVLYVNGVEVIKNPTGADRRQMRKEVVDFFGREVAGAGPATRQTVDENQNRYIWKAHEAMHTDIEPKLSRLIGGEVDQNIINKLEDRQPRFMPQPTFYSKAERAVEGAKAGIFNKEGMTSVGQAKALLEKNAPETELEWSGVLDYLDLQKEQSEKQAQTYKELIEISEKNIASGKTEDPFTGKVRNLNPVELEASKRTLEDYKRKLRFSQDKISKQDLLSYLKNNGVEVEEVLRSSIGAKLEAVEKSNVPDTLNNIYEIYRADDPEGDIYGSLGQLTEAAPEVTPSGRTNLPVRRILAKYGADRPFTLRLSAKNDTLTFKTLEEADQYIQGVVSETLFAPTEKFAGGPAALPGGENYSELVLKLPERSPEDTFYVPSGHRFPEQNILAHIRFTERTDADGKRMLFLDEVQSDWNSDIREKGVKKERPAVIQNEINRLFDERTTLRQNFLESYRDRTDKKALTEEMLASKKGKQFTKKIDNIEAKIAELTEKHPTNPAGAPNMPYKGSKWQDLVMKRMIRWAADNGYDRLGWITGKDTADRYDLSKVINEIAISTVDKDVRAIRLETGKGDSFKMMVDNDGKVDGAFKASQFNGKQLDEVIGKELAEKVMAFKSPGSLTGTDLKVGGEWASNLYDKSLPKIARKITKKKGAVGRVGLGVEVANKEVQKIDTMLEANKSMLLRDKEKFSNLEEEIGNNFTPEGARKEISRLEKELSAISEKAQVEQTYSGRSKLLEELGFDVVSGKLDALVKWGKLKEEIIRRTEVVEKYEQEKRLLPRFKQEYEANYVDISPEVKELAQEGFSYFMPEGRGGAASAPVQAAAPQPPSGVIIPKVKLTEEEKEESRQLLQQLLD